MGKKKKFDMDKIDKLLAQFPDEDEAAPKAEPKQAKAPKPQLPAGKSDQQPTKQRTETIAKRFAPVFAWISVAGGVALALGMTQWPYGHSCGAGLAVYLLAAAAVLMVGLWATVHSWNARLVVPHVLALGVVLWGMGLLLFQVLPRVGYAKAEASWGCSAEIEPPAPAVSPAATDPVAAQDATPVTDSSAAVDSLVADSTVAADSSVATDSATTADSASARDTIPSAAPDTSG